MPLIHPTALIDPAAELDPTVSVGAYSLIGPQVRIGAGTVVGPHCVIEGQTTIGRDNRFFQFCSIGAISQDMSYRGEPAQLHIGDRNTVREFCTFNLGTAKEDGITRIGSDNWIMAYVHVAHDVRLGNHCVLANGVTLAGHVHIGDWVTLGGLSGVLQFVHIGTQAMVGFQSHVSQDVPPFMTVEGHPLEVRAVNLTGLKRREFSPERLAVIKRLHRLLYRDSLSLEQAQAAMQQLRLEPEVAGQAAEVDVQAMLDFLAASRRGIAR